jgi:hypothetical protein
LQIRTFLVIALAAGLFYSGVATLGLCRDILRDPGAEPASAISLGSITIALALLLACGRAVVALLLRETWLHWHERWAAAWLIGCGVGAFAWFTLMPLYAWVSPIWLLTSVMAAISAIGGWWSIGNGPRPMVRVRPATIDYRPSTIDALLAVVLTIQIVVLFVVALHTPLGWDGLFNFEMKARLAFEHTPAGQLPLEYFSDPSQSRSHPHYPLLVPFTEFWLYTWLGRVDQSAVKVLFPIFYLSLTGFVAGAVRRVAGHRSGMLAAIALGLLPPLTLIPGAASGYADVPLAAAVAGAISFALVGISAEKKDAVVLGGVLLAVAVWTKSEGLIFAIAIGFSTLAVRRGDGNLFRKDRTKKVPVTFSLAVLWWVPVVAALPWIVFQQMYGQSSGDFHPVRPGLFVENLERLPTIALLFGRELFRPGHWALLFPVFFYLLAVMVRRHRNVADDFLAAIVVGPLTAYALMYVFSAWPDMREHIGTSLSRVLVPLAPLALIFIVRQLQADSSFEVREWA